MHRIGEHFFVAAGVMRRMHGNIERGVTYAKNINHFGSISEGEISATNQCVVKRYSKPTSESDVFFAHERAMRIAYIEEIAIICPCVGQRV